MIPVFVLEPMYVARGRPVVINEDLIRAARDMLRNPASSARKRYVAFRISTSTDLPCELLVGTLTIRNLRRTGRGRRHGRRSSG